MNEPIFDIRRDLKRVIVVLAVIIIPLMYSFFFLNAFWDPYSKLDKLPVAVVNLDKGAVVNSKQRNIGQEFVDELKGNNKLKWVFTSDSEAENGIKNREYYAIVKIPEDFSADIASINSSRRTQGVIIYEPQQKRNFLASQILNKAIMELDAEVTKKVVKETVNYVADQTGDVPEQLDELTDGLDKMHTDGTSKISENLGTLIDGQKKFNSGVNQVKNGLSEANTGAVALLDGSRQFASKQQQFSDALSKSMPQLKQLADGSVLFQKNLALLNGGLSKINAGAVEMNGKLPQLKAGLSKYSDSLKTFQAGLSPLATGLAPLKSGSTQVSSGLADYSTKMSAFNTGIGQYVGSVQTLSDTSKNIGSLFTAYVKAHPEAMQDKNIQTIAAAFQKSQGSLDQLSAASDSVKANSAALAAGSQKLADGSRQVNDGITKLADGAAPLSKGAEQLAAGAGTLSAGLDAVSGGTSQMMAAVEQASSGASRLNSGYAAINSGVQKTYGSMEKAAESAGLLSSAANKLSSGVSDLSSGISRLSDGSEKLSSNSGKLLDGEKKLYDGASELDVKVVEARDKVKDSKSDAVDQVAKLDGLGDFVSDPIKVDEKDLDAVSNYGVAFSPYFISLSLWVGALIMFIVIYLNPQIRFKRKLIKGAHMDIKFLIYPMIGILQGVGEGIILTKVLKLQPNNYFMFYLTIILTALTFVSIVQFLIVNLGDVGKFLAMLMLILQLTSSAGTFPNELVPRFFNVINPYMPMTYSVFAIKEAVSGHNMAFMYQNMYILAGIMFIFLLASLLLTGRKKTKSIDELESEYISKRGHSDLGAEA